MKNKTPNHQEVETVEDIVEEFMWQTKKDQHNIAGQYNPDFCDKLEERLRQALSQTRKEERERMVEIGEELRVIENRNAPAPYFTAQKATNRTISEYQQKIKNLDS